MKKLIPIVMLLAGVGIAKADVMYWMVGDSYIESTTAMGNTEAARLYMVYNNTETKLDSVTRNDIANFAAIPSSFDYEFASNQYGDGYSYFVELWNGNNWSRTENITYADAVANGYIMRPGLSTPTLAGMAGFGSGSTTYNVPEPTSGLLFLVGGMLLGLRRRRQG